MNDFSRFGRDYIESGRYIQKVFPALGVRFISVVDKFDSMTATSSDVHLLVPVKNFINDNYCRDISEKVRSHQKVMRENGQYIGAYVAYGYKKSDKDKNKIVVDDYAADVVKKIFTWKLAGMSEGKIADKLNAMGILSPSEYKKSRGINYKTGFKVNEKAKWSVVSIKRILTNRIYIGILEQGKHSRRNYKIKEMIENPKDQWIVVEDTHQKIVTKTEFDSVQKLLEADTRISPNKELNYLYSGLLYCGDCGNSMVRRVKKYKEKESVFYICSTNNRYKECSRHSINEENLNQIVMTSINVHIELIAEYLEVLNGFEKNNWKYEDILLNNKEISSKKKELEQCIKLLGTLCIDLSDGTINQEEYEELKDVYKRRHDELEKEILGFKNEMIQCWKNGKQNYQWTEHFIQNRSIKQLNRISLIMLVERIQIYEDKRIQIVFHFQNEFESMRNMVGAITSAKGVC